MAVSSLPLLSSDSSLRRLNTLAFQSTYLLVITIRELFSLWQKKGTVTVNPMQTHTPNSQIPNARGRNDLPLLVDDDQHTDFSAKPWSNGRDSTRQHLWMSSPMVSRGEWLASELETSRRTSSNADSSQGIARGPWLENPYSSSASRNSALKTGWFRYDARTMNLRHSLPTQIATWPAGTSDGTLIRPPEDDDDDDAAFLRQRRSIFRSRTM